MAPWRGIFFNIKLDPDRRLPPVTKVAPLLSASAMCSSTFAIPPSFIMAPKGQKSAFRFGYEFWTDLGWHHCMHHQTWAVFQQRPWPWRWIRHGHLRGPWCCLRRRMFVLFRVPRTITSPAARTGRFEKDDPWPVFLNLETIKPSTALSRSAVGKTTNGAKPPNSIEHFWFGKKLMHYLCSISHFIASLSKYLFISLRKTTACTSSWVTLYTASY